MRDYRFMMTSVLLLGLVLPVGSVLSRATAQDHISSNVDVVRKSKLSSGEKRALSLAAGRILSHVYRARVELRHKNGQGALGQVEKSLQLVRIIENASPAYKITSTIKSGDMTYRDEENVKDLIIPVYAELDESMSLLLPIKRAKRDLYASQSPESPGQQPADYQLQYTSVMLDVRETKYYLTEAEAALKKNELSNADRWLSAIQEDVIFEYDEQDLPLVKARWDLLEAARKITHKEYKEAKESLQKAASSLEVYTAQVGENVAGKARGLADQINELASHLDQKKEGAIDSINGLWDKLVKLF